MEKVELRTADIAVENAAKLAELFPDIVTEVLDEAGSVRHSIDVEALKAHVGDVAEDKREMCIRDRLADRHRRRQHPARDDVHRHQLVPSG